MIAGIIGNRNRYWCDNCVLFKKRAMANY